MSKVKKAKEHKFLNKHTVLGALLLMFFNFVFIEFFVGTIAGIICGHAGIDKTTGLAAGSIIGSLLALIIWFRFFSPEYKWKPESGSWGKSFKLLIPFFIYWVILFSAFGVYAKGLPFGAISISALLTSIMAGAGEEVAFREVGISYLARQWKDENKIILMAIIPAAAFSLIHLTNSVTDMDVVGVLEQMLLTFFLGVFFAAVYIRTGNIWPLILCHSLHDILLSSVSEKETALGVQFPDWFVPALGVVEGLLLVCGLYMLRKSKRGEIIALWNRRWSRDTGVTEEA